MGRRRKERRQQHGSAWHWQQTDAWYYTLPESKKRVALFDEQGRRIKGKENQALAEIALAKAKITWGDQTEVVATPPSQWLVAIHNGVVFFGILNGYSNLMTYDGVQ